MQENATTAHPSLFSFSSLLAAQLVLSAPLCLWSGKSTTSGRLGIHGIWLNDQSSVPTVCRADNRNAPSPAEVQSWQFKPFVMSLWFSPPINADAVDCYLHAATGQSCHITSCLCASGKKLTPVIHSFTIAAQTCPLQMATERGSIFYIDVT